MLGDVIATNLAALRAAAESRMTATCVITRDGEPVWNPVTMQNEATPVTAYAGRCRLRETRQQDHAVNAADQSFIASQFILSIPVAVSAVAKGDTVTITVSPDDPDLTGRKFTVVAVPASSQTTARRIPVRETQ